MTLTDRTAYIKEARAKYNSYNNEWQHDYFNHGNGGYLVVDKQRIEQSEINKQEKKKYDKEHDMCLTLAQNGHKVEYLKMTEGCFDIYLNGIAADLKKTKSYNNISGYAKKAIREQRAELVVFEFAKETGDIHAELELLKKINIHGYFYFSNNKSRVCEF